MKRIVLFFATLWLGVMGASAQGYRYDVNNDGSVNISDAIAVVNKILGKKNPGDVGGGEAVDLGLPSGILWSSVNIGASSPEEYGNYYAWGETVTKSNYSQSTYQYYQNGSYVNIGSDISGTQYDVATALWGDDWRMPTKDELQELMDNCTSEWTTVNGVNGRKFTSKTNGKSIFLPAAGYHWYGDLRDGFGYYWSSTQNPDYASGAYGLYFGSGNANWGSYYRYCGFSVRPVRPGKDNSPAEPIDLGLPSGTKWASCNVGATKPQEWGGYYAWGETEVKLIYTENTYKYYQNGKFVSLGSDISGTEYDVAHVKWGGKWVMPTLDDIKELLNNCTSEWTTFNGMTGRKFTGPSGNSIFLPATGARYDSGYIYNPPGFSLYWTSTLDEESSEDAYYLGVDSGISYWYASSQRILGLSVRPVIRK
ncbi:MAG: DUF1566 domain-containing protein [Prevotella sp.]|nr:DUF1566 domain-containing protein [Prevotella sp.]